MNGLLLDISEEEEKEKFFFKLKMTVIFSARSSL
jgi:hypothetical protein